MRDTHSVCPVCFKKIPAKYVLKGDSVFFEKTCPEHGDFSAVIWRRDIGGWLNITKWRNDPEDNCPHQCGLCENHRQNTCCIEVELTKRCNLSCPYCLENGVAKEPSLDELSELFKKFVAEGRTFVHLTGGEPTMREDLPEIVKAAKDAGCQYIQLNSNGVKLAEDKELVKKLADVGLSFVFLQFDGTDDEIYIKTRGEKLLDKKLKAIENCSEYNLGVSLVPTLVPGVNTHNIGGIIKFATQHSPAVRGVHFQPVSYFGRYPKAPTDDMRFTLPELLESIRIQAGIERDCFRLSSCDHPMCGFHGDFVVMPDGLLSLTKGQPEVKESEGSHSGCCCGAPTGDGESSCCCTEEQEESHDGCCCGAPSTSLPPMDAVLKNRSFVGRRWSRPTEEIDESIDVWSLEGFAQRLKTHGFTITSMAFQDAYTVDTDRLRNCSLHIWADGKIMPFCLRYILR